MAFVEHATSAISEKVIGAAIEVHKHLGPGLLESSYKACLCRELDLRNAAYSSEVVLPLEYKGMRIGKNYVIDLLIENSLIVEIKSVESLLPIHTSQMLTYMRLAEISAGLLINFNVNTLIRGVRRRLM
ncbi:MAG: GxxExxY protein [Gemmatimonadota bacterium]